MTRTIIAMVIMCVFAGPVWSDQTDSKLGPLFDNLLVATSPTTAQQTEAAIWSVWLQSGRGDVDELMVKGINAMHFRLYDTALEVFTEVIELAPDFAEGWNKRATVYWLMDNTDASVQDIQRTLALEPRHFGALSGMGLIFLGRGDDAGALQAFEAVLAVNPQSPSAQIRVKQLREKIGGEQV